MAADKVAAKNRYGFNGMEMDDDLNVDNYSSFYRVYNSKLGKWLSLEPKSSDFPFMTPYGFCYDSPIAFKDPNGDIPILIPILFIGLITLPNLAVAPTPTTDLDRVKQEHQKLQAMWLGVTFTAAAIPYIAPLAGRAVIASYIRIATSRTLQMTLANATLVAQRYGPDVANFVYGASTGDPMEPFPNAGQSADAGVAFRELVKKGTAILDFFGGSVSKYKNAISIDPRAVYGFKGTVKEFAELFKGTKVSHIIADNPFGKEVADFLIDASQLLEKGGTIVIRGTYSNPNFKQIIDKTAKGIENFDIIQTATKISDELKQGMKQTGGVTDIKGDVYEVVLQRK